MRFAWCQRRNNRRMKLYSKHLALTDTSMMIVFYRCGPSLQSSANGNLVSVFCAGFTSFTICRLFMVAKRQECGVRTNIFLWKIRTASVSRNRFRRQGKLSRSAYTHENCRKSVWHFPNDFIE